jgi:O-succinylbenzoate synthase
MLEKNKRKFALWVYPETLERIRQIYRQDNCQSQSEFIEKSIGFYLGFLESNRNTEFLSTAITQTVEAVIKNTEKRISNLQFKQAVGLLKVAKTLAIFAELDDEQQRKIHLESVNEAKQL